MTSGSMSLFGRQTSFEVQSELIKYCPTTNDHLVGVLSVKEHIMFASKMANGALLSYDHEAETEGQLRRVLHSYGLMCRQQPSAAYCSLPYLS
jgi:ABC-type multidrug transport system ATPase subunit